MIQIHIMEANDAHEMSFRQVHFATGSPDPVVAVAKQLSGEVPAAGRGVRGINGHGYVFVWLPESKRRIAEHILIAEKVLGRTLPPGAVVHHANGVRHDNRNCNLVICEDATYHRLLHRRMRLIALGADPNTESFCVRCKQVLPVSQFSLRRDGSGYCQSHCKPCDRELHVAIDARRYPARKLKLQEARSRRASNVRLVHGECPEETGTQRRIPYNTWRGYETQKESEG